MIKMQNSSNVKCLFHVIGGLNFRYSEKATQIWKKSPNCFEHTIWSKQSINDVRFRGGRGFKMTQRYWMLRGGKRPTEYWIGRGVNNQRTSFLNIPLSRLRTYTWVSTLRLAHLFDPPTYSVWRFYPITYNVLESFWTHYLP